MASSNATMFIGLAWLGLWKHSRRTLSCRVFFHKFHTEILTEEGRIAPYLRFFVFPGKGGSIKRRVFKVKEIS